MMYLLDTNICVHAMNTSTPALLARMNAYSAWEIGISSITLAELEFGVVWVAPEQQAGRRFLLDALSRRVQVFDFDAAAARAYAQVRQADPQRNRNALDKLITAHALSLGAVLVTNNVTDFQRVPGLIVENWVAG